MPKTAAVILAAGKGTRMRSELPKVLHKVAGKYLVQHVLEAAEESGVEQNILVVGHGKEQVQEALGMEIIYAWQQEQLGTGHAVMQAVGSLAVDVDRVLVLCGDTPLLTAETLIKLKDYFEKEDAKAVVLTALLGDPVGYGRIIRDGEGRVTKIVEHRDATPEELMVREVNSGTYYFAKEELLEALSRLQPDNAQGEYYLTDVIGIFKQKDWPVSACQVKNAEEIHGINSRIQLAEAEAAFRKRINEKLMLNGITMIDPASTYIEAGVEMGADTIIYPFTVLKGQTRVGQNCIIGPNVTVVDSSVGDEARIRQAVLEEAQVGKGCQIGPFSYLRPGTVLAEGVRIGDFVEIKKSFVGKGSKVPHLTYIGDAVIGEGVNVGAGTITCNYDGKNKWQTEIEDGAFIGSNSNLVAPVKIGEGAYVAAGSTITEDVPGKSLGVARGRQVNIQDWTVKNNLK